MDITLQGAVRSKTIWFSGALVALGVMDQVANVIPMIVPDEYRGIAIAAVGLVSAVLRAVTNRPLSAK